MSISPMDRLQLLFARPLDEPPYNLLRYKRTDAQGVHLYDVYALDGRHLGEGGALKAIQLAHREHPGECWYCDTGIPISSVHRDHVKPRASKGGNDLHNIVIACPKHNCAKSNMPIAAFDAHGATKYLDVLHDHLSRVARAHQR